MNDETQLKAMVAELTAAGYEVLTDVRGELIETEAAPKLTRMEGIKLDIVAELAQPDKQDGHQPHLLIIEIANRRRSPEARLRTGRAPPRYVEDDEALKRFEIISAGLADVPYAELQIRFFDVSADQASARQLKGPLKAKDVMLKRLLEDQSTLVRSAGRDDLSRALLITRLWSHWLRIVGNLHPGRERRELKSADLRTIQKDLYDQKVIDLTPGRYASIHRSLLAVFEGGDVEVRDLLELQPQVRRLLDWAADRYEAPRLETEPTPDSLFGRILKQIQERVVGQRREDLDAAVAWLWLKHESSSFPSAVADFLLTLRREPIVNDDLITELLEQAARSPS
jgi:hypothetical protein